MTDQPPDLSDIRQTGDDAERLLRLLDDPDRGDRADMLSVQADREERAAHPLLIVLIGAVLLAPLIVFLWAASRPSSVAPNGALRWQASCGSSSSPGDVGGRCWDLHHDQC